MATIIKNQDILHLLTGRTPLALNRLLGHYLKVAGVALTREQWSIMAVLWEKDGLTQQALTDATYRDRPGTTRLLDNLEKEGLVVRRPHETDRRTNLVFLTPKGREIEKPVVGALTQTVEAITQNISASQLDTLRTVFELINQNMQHLTSNPES